MKFYFCFLSLLLAFVSCKKNTSDLSIEQKEAQLQKTLDSLANIKFGEIIKEDVDTYPIFKGVCDNDSITTKQAQKECFEKTFTALFQERLKKDPYEVTEPITERITLYVKVDNVGKIILTKMEADERTKELLSTNNETFEDSLRANLSMLSDNDAIIPATKNGQNVSTEFTFPVEIKVK